MTEVAHACADAAPPAAAARAPTPRARRRRRAPRRDRCRTRSRSASPSERVSADSTQPGGRRHADAEPVVLAHVEERERQALERALRRRVQRRLRRRVVQRGVSERAERRSRRASMGTARRAAPRGRSASAIPTARGSCEAIVDVIGTTASSLRPKTLCRPPAIGSTAAATTPSMMSRMPSIPRLGRPREVEGARAVVEERGIVDAQRERDGRIRLVTRRADRVEAPAVLLEPAGGVVRLAAVDLRPPELLHLWRRRRAAPRSAAAPSRRREDAPRAGRARRARGPRRRTGSRPRPAAPARRSTRPRPRARSSARGARMPPERPRRSRRRRPTPRSADACSARPYENDSGHGPPTWLIAFRFSVASTSD